MGKPWGLQPTEHYGIIRSNRFDVHMAIMDLKGITLKEKQRNKFSVKSQFKILFHKTKVLIWKDTYKLGNGTSLVAQWLRIRLPMQGTRVQALVREDPTCRGATKPVRHNY